MPASLTPHPRGATVVPVRRRHRPLVVVALALAVLVALGLAACGSSSPSTTAPGGTTPTGADAGPTGTASGTITVFAAASLKEAFTEMASAFERANPDAHVTLSFAASSALARQIVEGAPADVFASADAANMAKVADAGELAGEARPFATNRLQIIVAPGNPEDVTTLADLARPGLIYVTAGPEVPIGAYAARLLADAGVEAQPSSLEADVKGIVTKVTSGEADAGIVYATDVAAAGDAAQGVDVPPDPDVVATYPLGVTATAPNPDGAAAWVAFVTGPEGRAVLASFGFGPA